MPGRRRLLLVALALAPAAVVALIVAAPEVGPFVRGASLAILVASLGLLAARRWVRVRPDRRGLAELLAIGVAGVSGLLLLFQNVLVHDALWYYGYLRSALVQGDLDMYDEFVLRNPNGMYLPPPDTPVFHLGTSILQAPFAILIRPLAVALGRAGILPGGDGYGPLEIGAATFSSMLLALGGVALTHRLARRLVPGTVSAVAQVALLYGSPLAFFTFVWPAYPHAASVFLAALFLLLWAREDRSEGAAETGAGVPGTGGSLSFLLGLLGGALALVHPQDCLYLALPLVDQVAAWHSTPGVGGTEGRRTVARRTVLLALGAVLGFAPQLLAWRLTSGHFLPHVYAEIGDPFRWQRPAFLAVLFSGYNGLLAWTPLCGLAACGLAFLRRSRPRLFRGFLLILVLEWWAIASYGYWWGGASFGARYFLSVYPVLGIGLALGMARLARRAGLLLAGLLASPVVYWNLLLMAQFRLEWIRHNSPPDFTAILRRQILEAPAAIARGLCGSFGWNKVAFLENLRAAIETGSFTRILAVVGVAILLSSGLVLWIVWIGGALPRRADMPRPTALPLRWTARLGALAAIAATLAVGAVAPGHDGTRLLAVGSGGPLRIRPGSSATVSLERDSSARDLDGPTAVAARMTAPLPAGGQARLDLVSFLRSGEEADEGDTVASVTALGPGCDGATFPLRAGIETAETAPDRFEVLGRARHDLSGTTPIQSWWQDDFSARHYWGHAYLASFDLPADCRPRRVVLRRHGGPGDLEVRLVAIATEEDRP